MPGAKNYRAFDQRKSHIGGGFHFRTSQLDHSNMYLDVIGKLSAQVIQVRS
jgi:hypothetical protein